MMMTPLLRSSILCCNALGASEISQLNCVRAVSTRVRCACAKQSAA